MPSYVKRARNSARVVPVEIISAIILPPSSSVAELLEQPDPNGGPVDIFFQPSYTLSPPNLILDIHDPISFSSFLTFVFACIPHHPRLSKSFDDAWLSGSQSITASAHSVPLCIRKNVIWKSLSISCGFPKNRKFREIMEIDRKFWVTTANFSEGLEIVQRFS